MGSGTLRNKAINYAENELGVHEVYRDVQAAEGRLAGPEGLLAKATKTTSELRYLEHALENVAVELRVTQRTLNEEMSATAFEAHLKVVTANDDNIGKLKASILEAKLRLDEINDEIRETELAHRGGVARLNTLGGYLQYLAAAKNSHTQARASVTDWPY